MCEIFCDQLFNNFISRSRIPHKMLVQNAIPAVDLFILINYILQGAQKQYCHHKYCYNFKLQTIERWTFHSV